jgi:ribonuclease BN (tRNA processing enzyme)
MHLHRRSFLSGLAGATLPFEQLRSQSRIAGRTRLILLGTAGGPRPRRFRSGSAQAIVAGGKIYVVDCGDGVARQMILAGLKLRDLRHVLITHHHSDHNADFGTLLQLAWMSGLVTPVGCWGPPPTEEMLQRYLQYQQYDISLRARDEGRIELAPLMKGHNLSNDGLVFADDHVRVTAAKVPHPPLELALAYRFDASDRSIVISGDTNESDSLVRLAKGADVLVHEVMLAERVKEMLRALPNHEALARSVIGHHTTAEQVGRVAAKAGVKLLVLSHFVPAEDPTVPDGEWLAPVRRYFSGPVVIGRDLLEV